jgi:hypothetical protein
MIILYKDIYNFVFNITKLKTNRHISKHNRTLLG